MKTYLLDTFNRYKRFSEKLDAKTVLCNKCWWVFNDAGQKETYIFKEDGTILISISGAVTYGKWEYLPVNKSIIISGNNQSFMVLPSFVDEYILALQVDGTNNFAFLIDEQNKSKFAPKTYQDVIGYFEEKERRIIEVQKKEEQRLLEAKRQREIEVEKKRQEDFINQNKNKANDLVKEWNLFRNVLALPACLCSITTITIISFFFLDSFSLEKLGKLPMSVKISAILGFVFIIFWKPYQKWKIRRYIKKHPNDPVNPFLKEHL